MCAAPVCPGGCGGALGPCPQSSASCLWSDSYTWLTGAALVIAMCSTRGHVTDVGP